MALSLCIIVKDEAEELERCLASVKDFVDEIVVVVTSSDELTFEVAWEYSAVVEYFAWCDDFSKARNYSFSLATNDFIFWLDADDEVENAAYLKDVKDLLNRNQDKNYCVMFPYNYEIDDNGLVVSAHWRERIVSKNAFIWKGRVHETFIPLKPFIMVRDDKIKINHRHKKDASISKHERNLRILEKSIQEDAFDARTLYYYANTLKGLGRLDESISNYEKYIEVSGWPEEKYLACIRLSECYDEKGNTEKAIYWSLEAVKINPRTKDAYFKLGQIYFKLEELDKSLFWIEQCLKQKSVKDTAVVVNPRNHDYNPLILMAEILMKQNRYEEAIACFNKLIEFNPDYKLLEYNRRVAQKGLNVKLASKALADAVNFCLQNEELEKAEILAKNAPIEVRNSPNIQKLQLRTKNIMDRIRGYEKGIRVNSPDMIITSVPNIETEKKFNALLVNLVTRPDIVKILDVGCYNGWLTNELSKRGWITTGVDIGQEALDVAKFNADKKQLGTKFKRMTFDKIGAEFHSEFDAVVCFDVLEHTTKPKELIKNLEQACKPNGWIFLNVPNGANHQGFMDTQNDDLWEHAHSYEYQDIVKMFNGRKNLNILYLKNENASAFYSPGQSSLFIMYQNEARQGRDITIYCGNTEEAWSPLSESTGIGGSEEAVINISRELVKQGNKVTVYNNCEGQEGIYEDVTYIHFDSFNLLDAFDIFIGWRNPQVFALPMQAKQKYLWLHDIPQIEFYQPEVVDKIDKIFVLSKWHRNCLPNIPDSKFFITRNGINISDFDITVDREPQRLIYASSPDRGLDILLDMWPEIKKEVPSAELHVFYGWTVFDILRTTNERKQWKQNIQEAMKQDGVYDRGRVGHKELAKEYLKSGIWFYPTGFSEISCISAMKAQMAGALPVCTDLAALKETIKYGTIVEGSIYDGDNKEKIKNLLIHVLKSPRECDYILEMQNYARKNFSWKSVTTDWVNLFDSCKN